MRQSLGKMDDYPKPLLISLLWLLSLIIIHSSASAQTQTGFISIDCGGEGEASYIDTTTGVMWQPDGPFVTLGTVTTIKDPYLLGLGITSKELTTLRYFEEPNINKFCYNLGPLDIGNYYLLRASFLHGSYNGDLSGSFDLLVEGDLWDTISVKNTSTTIRKEMYIVAKAQNVSVCVGSSLRSFTPFISSIEVRPLDPDMASTMSMNDTNLVMYMTHRYNFGASTPEDIRYPHDKYDRIWYARTEIPKTTTENPITSTFMEAPPDLVMKSAFLSSDNYSKGFIFGGLPLGKYIFQFYFAEIEIGVENGDRVFNIYKDESFFDGPVDIKNQTSVSFKTYGFYYSDIKISNSTLFISLKSTIASRLPPIWNAFELLRFSYTAANATTLIDDVEALSEMKMSIGLSNWTGDPCLPLGYGYPWVTCSLNTPPRVTSLLLPEMDLQGSLPSSLNLMNALTEINFENNRLSGNIPNWSALSKLEIINLGNNNLSGTIPDFLGDLPSLVELLLQDNNFNGEIPKKLQEKASSSRLQINVSGNKNLCLGNCAPPPSPSSAAPPVGPYPTPSTPQTPGYVKIVIIVVPIVGGIFILSLGIILCWCIRFKQRQDVHNIRPLEPTPNIQDSSPLGESSSTNVERVKTNMVVFTSEQIMKATTNLAMQIGEGGFGRVFLGTWRKQQIAVKVLYQNSDQGVKQFSNEVKVLTKVHHKNLVPFVGYCETKMLALVYKYMSNKSLRCQLDDSSSIKLSWTKRLIIALDAAQGLEYLHTLCDPIIIHGDVKSSNILVDENMQGKFGDFGLSRFHCTEADMTKTIIGSNGYVDPLFIETHILDVKNDIYSFGVVLLEIITGRRAYDTSLKPKGKENLADWVSKRYFTGLSVMQWIDPRLQSEHHIIETVSMVLEIAMKCLKEKREDRPTMHDVVNLLADASKLEQNKVNDATITLQMTNLPPKLK